MYRVVARHPDKDHHDHAWHQVAGPFDYLDEAELSEAALDRVQPESQSLAPEEPVRPDPERPLAEALAAGYETKLQELHADGDDAHRWKDVG